MTLYILESGINTASEVTKKFFKRTKFFFVRKNHNGTMSFIDAMSPEDILTTSYIKNLSQADNGYMKITTQNSVINITPFVIGCKKLYPYLVEEMMGYCSFVKAEHVPYLSDFCGKRGETRIVRERNDLMFISKDSISQPFVEFIDDKEVEGWVDADTILFKDKEGYLYLEFFADYDIDIPQLNKHQHSFIKTNIKIG